MVILRLIQGSGKMLNRLCCGIVFVIVGLLFAAAGFGFSLSDLPGGSSFSPGHLAKAAADAVITVRGADENFPVIPLRVPSLFGYAEGVAAKLEKHSINRQMMITLLMTARVQGQSSLGSEIYITRGMLNMMANEAELACLIGHEIGHADLNHFYADRNDGILAKLTGMGITAAGQATGKEDIAADIEDKRNVIMRASWSRDNEQAADEYGAVLAAKAGYDPYAFCDLFDRLMLKVNADTFYRLGTLVSTHKALDERASHLREFLRGKGYKQGKGILNKQAFMSAMSALKGIHTGEGAKDSQSKEDPEEIKVFSGIVDELKQHQQDGTKLPAARFLEIMRTYSEFFQKNHVTSSQLKAIAAGIDPLASERSGKSADGRFMDETIYQDNFFDPDSEDGLGRAGKLLVMGLNLIAKTGLSIAAPEIMIPIMAFEALDGHDCFTGDKLTTEQRILSGLGAFAAAGSEAYQFGKSFETFASSDQAAAEIAGDSLEVFQNAEKSPTLSNMMKDSDFTPSNFYAREDGSIIPANGYRYIDSNDGRLSQYLADGEIPASTGKGTYVSFNDYDNMETASNSLQMKSLNDARYKIEFDTGQIAEEIKIPNGNWGKSDWLEPMTKDYPEFGDGGATQAVTNASFKIGRIIDLKTGDIIYGN